MDNFTSNPKITVVIPVYKTEKTLARTVESVLAQTFNDYNILIVDDGTPDSAGKIADGYAEKYPNRIRVVHQENRGPAEARRTGALNADGEYLMMLDSDDTIPVKSLETMYSLCAKDDLDALFGSYMRKYPDREFPVYQIQNGVLDAETWTESLFRDVRFGQYCIIKRKFWLGDVYPAPEDRMPSEEFILFLRMNLQRVGCTNEIIYNYYYNCNSLSISGTFVSIEKYKTFFAYIRQTLQERGEMNKYEHLVKYLEIDLLTFSIKSLNRKDEWVKSVLSYDTSAMPKRYRMLQRLLKMPDWVRHSVIKANRIVKRILGKV